MFTLIVSTFTKFLGMYTGCGMLSFNVTLSWMAYMYIPYTPDVNGWSITFLPQEQFWRSVPQCDYFVGVRPSVKSRKKGKGQILLNKTDKKYWLHVTNR